MKDDPQKPTKVSKGALLGELESIKDLLDKHQLDETTANNIPILNDIVEKNSLKKNDDDQPLGLNLDNIFDDADDNVFDDMDDIDNLGNLDELDINISIPDFTLSTSVQQDEQYELAPVKSSDYQPQLTPMTTSHTNAKSSDISLDHLIQEIVDGVIPELEVQLRQRLLDYGPEAIKQLSLKHTNQ